jgi:hypothetical protein
VQFHKTIFLAALFCASTSAMTAFAGRTPPNADKPETLSGGFNPLSDYKGHFEGSESDHFENEYHKRAIHSDFDLSSKNPVIVAKDTNGNVIINLEFVKISGKQIQLRLSALQNEIKTLNKEDTCFSDSVHQTLMCFYDDGMDLDVTSDAGDPVVSVSLTHFAVEKPMPVETPQAFDLRSALARALQMNFDNRIEFEHVVQAKQTARAAYANLMPHLSINSVAALIGPTPSSILSVAGDLVPFLLPSRWLQAKRAKILAQAEAQALTLMRMDTATNVEGLFYSTEHDRIIQAAYKDLLAKAEVAYKEVEIYEQVGKYRAGSKDEVKSVILKMSEDSDTFDVQLTEDVSSISQALGFFTPDAVSSATLGTEPDNIEKATPADVKQVTKDAVDRSLELKQIDDLAAAAMKNKTSIFFNWLDPVGDSTAELGFNLKANFAVAESQIRELQLRRNDIQSNLEQKAKAASVEFNESLITYAKAKEGLAVDQRRLERFLNFISVGASDVDLFHTTDLVSDVLDSSVRLADATAAFRISRGKIDRLLLQGFYAHPDKPVPPPPVTTPNGNKK